MRIDSHQHFWKYDADRDQWITEDMAVLRRDFMPEDLVPLLERNSIEGCIAVQTDQSEGETEFLLDLASRFSAIRGVVGWVNLRSPNVHKSLKKYSECRKFRGVRHIVQSEPDDRFMVREDFVNGIAALQDHGLTYDILVYPHQLPAAIELVSRFPSQPFVLDHIAKPSIRTGKQNGWIGQLRELSQSKDVYCKVSGLVTEADWQSWTASDIFPYLDVVFEAFGCDRVMFGSDWPVCLLAGTYDRVLSLVRDYTSGFSHADQDAFFGLNAARFYGV